MNDINGDANLQMTYEFTNGLFVNSCELVISVASGRKSASI